MVTSLLYTFPERHISIESQKYTCKILTDIEFLDIQFKPNIFHKYTLSPVQMTSRQQEKSFDMPNFTLVLLNNLYLYFIFLIYHYDYQIFLLIKIYNIINLKGQKFDKIIFEKLNYSFHI